MKKAIIILIIVFSSKLFSQTENNLGETYIIEVKVNDFGKVQTQSESFYQVTEIPKKFITSSFYVYKQEKLKIIPINDKYFNYDYFRESYYPIEKGKIIKLLVKKFTIENEEYYVAYKLL